MGKVGFPRITILGLIGLRKESILFGTKRRKSLEYRA